MVPVVFSWLSTGINSAQMLKNTHKRKSLSICRNTKYNIFGKSCLLLLSLLNDDGITCYLQQWWNINKYIKVGSVKRVSIKGVIT